MKRNLCMLSVLLSLFVGCGGAQGSKEVVKPELLHQYTQDIKSVCALFPKTAQEINDWAQKVITEAQQSIDAIVAIPDNERTFDNTARALDTIYSNYYIQGAAIATIMYVSPDDAVRDAAKSAEVKISQAGVDIFGQNLKLYKAFKAYYETTAQIEQLTAAQRYFVDEAMSDFKRSGLDLPEETRVKVTQLQKELSQLCTTFENNVNADASFIEAMQEELAGTDADLLSGLKRTDDGKYKVGVDYPTFFAVMEHCTVQDTRKRLYKKMLNKAYPANMDVLNQIIEKRDQLAQLLGYKSYAHLNIDDEMAQSPEIAEAFICELVAKAQKKNDLEFERLKADLPPSVALSPEGKMYPWNGMFAKAWYKKKHFQLDERQVSEYFPMQQTIDRLLTIYQNFFDVTMHQEPINCLWVEDLTLITVHNKKDNQLLGYLILDLYPRANKYGHACHIGIAPALTTQEGLRIPSFSVVIANLPKPAGDKPALLKRSDAETFFHEFGHALHAIFGSCELASHSGTRVKKDFVEMPSQMLEEWLCDKDILKYVTGHYKTGEPLPDNIIDTIIAQKNFSSGGFVLGQSNSALFSLRCFGPGGCKDTEALQRELHAFTSKHSVFDPEAHHQASFGHLTGYGARYYGYLWSKVFALDLFEHIKQFGLMNPEIGTVYAQKVIGKGGSEHPMNLLKDFLGREPNQEAFLKDLGL